MRRRPREAVPDQALPPALLRFFKKARRRTPLNFLKQLLLPLQGIHLGLKAECEIK